MLDLISFKDEEIAEGSAGYSLIEIDWSTPNLQKKVKEVKILWDDEEIQKKTIETESKEFNNLTFPLKCFENKKSDPKELNFNELDSCSMKYDDSKSIFFHNYVVAGIYEKADNPKHKFHELHSEKPTLKIELIYDNSNEKTFHNAKLLKLFNENYSPPVKKNNSSS